MHTYMNSSSLLKEKSSKSDALSQHQDPLKNKKYIITPRSIILTLIAVLLSIILFDIRTNNTYNPINNTNTNDNENKNKQLSINFDANNQASDFKKIEIAQDDALKLKETINNLEKKIIEIKEDSSKKIETITTEHLDLEKTIREREVAVLKRESDISLREKRLSSLMAGDKKEIERLLDNAIPAIRDLDKAAKKKPVVIPDASDDVIIEGDSVLLKKNDKTLPTNTELKTKNPQEEAKKSNEIKTNTIKESPIVEKTM